MKMQEEQPDDQEGQAHDQEELADEEEQEESADNQEEHPDEQEEQDEEQPNEKKLQTESGEILTEQMIHENCTDVHDSEKDGEDGDKKGGNDVKEQAHVEQPQNKQEEQLLHQREKAGDHLSEEIEKPEKEECVGKEQPKEKLEVKVINGAGEQSEGQELLKIAAERPLYREQQLRREAEEQLLKEEQLRKKEEQLRKEVEHRLQQMQEEAESKRQELEEQVKIQEQALQNAEVAFKAAILRKGAEVKEVEADLESFMKTKDEEEGKLRSQLKSAKDDNAKLKIQLQKMQKNVHAAGLETSTSIRGGGARILTVKRRLDNPGGVGEGGEDVMNKVSTSKKREATTSNQEAVVRIKKMKGPIACDENENLDISEEVEDEDVVEVEVEVDGTWGEPVEDPQVKKVEKSKNIVMCKKCKDVLPTKEFLKLHTCGNISSVRNASSRRK